MELELKPAAREKIKAIMLDGDCPELHDLTDCGDCPLALFDNEATTCQEIAEALMDLLEQ